MDLMVLCQGLLTGFSIAAPVGPIGILCIRRTLVEGRAAGLLTGLGAATADGVYGLVAGFGLTFVSNFLLNQKTLLSMTGGLFLCYLGLKTLLARPAPETAQTRPGGLLVAYSSTFVLTLTNPATVFSFAAIFAGLGLGETTGDYARASLFVCGVLVGSALWWIALSTGVSLLHAKFTPTRLQWVNYSSGLIISSFGLAILLSLFG